MRFDDSLKHFFLSYFCLFLSWFDPVLFFMQVHDWPVGPLGLLHDRSWMVVNGNGVCLSQKRAPRLSLVRPQVHLPSNKLLLQASGQTVCQRLTEKNPRCFAKRNFNLWILFVRGFVYIFPIALQEWIAFQFPWKTNPKCTQALKRVRAKFVVTGELAMLKHLKAAAAGNTATHKICPIFFTHINAFSLSIVLDATFLLRMAS